MAHLPPEIIVLIADHCDSATKFRFLLSSRSMCALVKPVLYRNNARQDKSSALLWAAEHGVLSTVQFALANGAKPDAIGPNEPESPADLQASFSSGDEFGPEEEYCYGTALHMAALEGHDDVISVLLDAGADIDALSLHLCDCEYLSNHILNMFDDAYDFVPRWRPLHYAVCNGHASTAALLLARGASPIVSYAPMAEPNYGLSILHSIAASGATPVLERLLQDSRHNPSLLRGIDINAIDYNSNTVMHYATANRDAASAAETVLLLRDLATALSTQLQLEVENHDRREGYTPLLLAVELANHPVADALLDLGADAARTTGRQGWTALHFAVERADGEPKCVSLPHSRLPVGATPGYEASAAVLVRKLIAHGADVEAWNGRDETVLQTVAAWDLPEVGRALLDGGADANAMHSNGRGPLHDAAQWRTDGLVRLLLEHGADVELMDWVGRNPLDSALFELRRGYVKGDKVELAKCEKIVAMILQRGLRVDARPPSSLTKRAAPKGNHAGRRKSLGSPAAASASTEEAAASIPSLPPSPDRGQTWRAAASVTDKRLRATGRRLGTRKAPLTSTLDEAILAADQGSPHALLFILRHASAQNLAPKSLYWLGTWCLCRNSRLPFLRPVVECARRAGVRQCRPAKDASAALRLEGMAAGDLRKEGTLLVRALQARDENGKQWAGEGSRTGATTTPATMQEELAAASLIRSVAGDDSPSELLALALLAQDAVLATLLLQYCSGLCVGEPIAWIGGRPTIMHLVARAGDPYLARQLVELGANVNVLDGLGLTPLAVALQEENASVVEILVGLGKADWALKGEPDRTRGISGSDRGGDGQPGFERDVETEQAIGPVMVVLEDVETEYMKNWPLESMGLSARELDAGRLAAVSDENMAGGDGREQVSNPT